MYNGDSFGYLMGKSTNIFIFSHINNLFLDKPVTGGPYLFFDDPQYLGTVSCLLGYAVYNQSRIGYGLTGYANI